MVFGWSLIFFSNSVYISDACVHVAKCTLPEKMQSIAQEKKSTRNALFSIINQQFSEKMCNDLFSQGERKPYECWAYAFSR